jgi:hypothetical protein
MPERTTFAGDEAPRPFSSRSWLREAGGPLPPMDAQLMAFEASSTNPLDEKDSFYSRLQELDVSRSQEMPATAGCALCKLESLPET